MRVYKRGGVYQFQFEHNGIRYRKSTHTKDQRVARQIATAFHAALLKGEVGIVERKAAPGFSDAMKLYLDWSKLEHGDHPDTTARYTYASLPLIAYFKNRALDKITPADVEDYKSTRSRQSVRGKGQQLIKPATVNREIAVGKAMFNYAIKSDEGLRNPFTKVDMLPEDNTQDRVLDYHEEDLYLAAATETLRDIAGLILETGMRPEEVENLTEPALYLENGYLRVLKGKTKAARRRIDLSDKAIEILERRLRMLQDRQQDSKATSAVKGAKWLFPCEIDASRPLPGVQSAHSRALRDSGVAHFRVYDLRHTFATRAAESGMPLPTLAKVLGHARITMVLRYAHPTDAHQTEAMEKLAAHKELQRGREMRRREDEAARREASGIRLVPKSA